MEQIIHHQQIQQLNHQTLIFKKITHILQEHKTNFYHNSTLIITRKHLINFKEIETIQSISMCPTNQQISKMKMQMIFVVFATNKGTLVKIVEANYNAPRVILKVIQQTFVDNI